MAKDHILVATGTASPAKVGTINENAFHKQYVSLIREQHPKQRITFLKKPDDAVANQVPATFINNITKDSVGFIEIPDGCSHMIAMPYYKKAGVTGYYDVDTHSFVLGCFLLEPRTDGTYAPGVLHINYYNTVDKPKAIIGMLDSDGNLKNYCGNTNLGQSGSVLGFPTMGFGHAILYVHNETNLNTSLAEFGFDVIFLNRLCGYNPFNDNHQKASVLFDME